LHPRHRARLHGPSALLGGALHAQDALAAIAAHDQLVRLARRGARHGGTQRLGVAHLVAGDAHDGVAALHSRARRGRGRQHRLHLESVILRLYRHAEDGAAHRPERAFRVAWEGARATRCLVAFAADAPAVAAAVVAVAGGRLASKWLRRRWEEARAGGKILTDKRAYVRRVVVPQVLSWGCKIGVVAVLLAAYGIPVGFHSVFSVIGGNSLANLASLTPGGVGISQAFAVASLQDYTSAAAASAYSIGQQLLTTVWNIVLAAVLVAVAFGRSGGKRLVEESSARARELHADQHA
jgi:hypothetical protein